MYLDSANNCISQDTSQEYYADLKQKAIMLTDYYVSLGMKVEDIIDNIVMKEELLFNVPNIKDELKKHYSIS